MALPSPNYQHVHTARDHTRGVTSVQFSPNGALVASASADKTVRVWNGRTLEAKTTLKGLHEYGLNDIAWSNTSQYLATASDDRSVGIWDVETGVPLNLLAGHEGHRGFVFCVSFNPRSNIIASGGFDEHVKLWDVRTGKLMRNIEAHSDPVSSVHFDYEGQRIVSSSFDGMIRLWDAGSGQCIRTIQSETKKPYGHVRFVPNGKFILASSLDNRITLIDHKKGQGREVKEKVLKTYTGHTNTQHCCTAAFGTASVNEKHKYMVSGSEDNNIFVWSVNNSTKKPLQILKGHTAPVIAVACHPTDPIVVSGALEKDSTVRMWKAGGGGDGASMDVSH